MVSITQDFSKHHILQSSSDVKSICSPLEELGKLDFFSFVRSYSDASFNALTALPEWTDYILTKQLIKTSTFEQPPRFYQSSTVLWSSIKEDKARADLRQFFNVSEGVSFINKQENYCDFFHFSIKNNGIPIYQSYVNWLDILQKFSIYFLDQAAGLIKESCKNKIFLRNTSEQQKNATRILRDAPQWTAKSLYSKVKLKTFHAIGYDGHFKNLTHKECLVSAWLVKGRTSEEIGLILGLSRKTVEEYLNNVKKKLNCAKQAELGYQLAILGFNPNDYDI